MGVIFKKNKLTSFASETSLRFDYLFNNFVSQLSGDYYTYKELFDIVEYSKLDISALSTIKYAEIGNVEKTGDVNPVTLSFDNSNELNESLFKKIEKGDIIKPQKGDILISKIRPYLNKNVFIDAEEIYFTKAFIQIRPKINSVIFYHTLRSIFFKNLNAVSRQGKGYPTLKEDDLKIVRFPKKIIDAIINKQVNLANKIIPIEQEIKQLKESKKDVLSIINEVIGDELGFDWGKFEDLKKQKIFTSSLLEFSNNIDCRYSYKFHNKAGKYVYNFLVSKTDKRIKDFISEPIVLGKGVSPKDYDENGEYFYIAMSNIKNWRFEEEGCKKVKKEYWSKNLNKTVQKNDIILARSGEGTIGKVALIEDENLKAIFADFTQRIRLKNYNRRLAYYYFRSDLFQYLVYTHKKGLGNNTNIFPSQIQEFPIPDWSEEKQTEIVEKIKSRIDAQKKIDKQIMEKQNEISELIENAIKENANA